MKRNIYDLKTVTFFSLFLFSVSSPYSEYNSKTSNSPEMEIHFNAPQSKTVERPIQSGARNRHLHRMLEQISCNNYVLPTSTTPFQSTSALQHVHNGFQNQRQNIIQQFINNDPNAHALYSKKYYIPEISKQYLTAHNINTEHFQLCEGNLLQHAIHQEFMVLTDATAHLWSECHNSTNVKELTNVIADFADAGVFFNHIGEIQKAISLADAGWALLDCVQAAGEGFTQGIGSIGHTVLHPVQTVQNYAQAITTCGYFIGAALKEITHFIGALESDQLDLARNKYLALGDQCNNIAQALNEQRKDVQLRDIIKSATQWTIESYATTRALNGLSNFFNHAQKNAAQIARKISNGMQESSILMSAEGIPVRVAQEVITQTKKIPTSNDKLLQLLSKFEGKKIKIGNNTFLLDKRGLKHILERHHPLYWNGTIKDIQTFLPEKTTVSDIVKTIKQVMKLNKKTILEQGTNRAYKIEGIINGAEYRVGFNNGRIGQFFMHLKQ